MTEKDSEKIQPVEWIALLGFAVLLICGLWFYVMVPMVAPIERMNDRLHYHTIDYIENINIESLRDDNRISGQFILGSGYVGQQPVYVFYIKDDDGGYVRNQINAEVSTIYMDENVRPYITKHFSETDKLHKKFESSYSIHVPNDTVTRKYNVG